MVEQYPANKPFVVDNQIELEGNLSKDERKNLQTNLPTYWDDSSKARSIGQIKLWKYPRYRYLFTNPPVLDSMSVERSRAYMFSYLQSEGYYNSYLPNDSIYRVKIGGYNVDSVKNMPDSQFRLHPNGPVGIYQKILTGKATRFSSVEFAMADSMLQHIALSRQSQSLLRPGLIFSKNLVSSELDRLVKTYRDSGYYQFYRDNIYALVDTINTDLLETTLDPFAQALKIVEAQKIKQQRPEASISIRERSTDSLYNRRYRWGNVYYYTDVVNEMPDSILSNLKRYRFKEEKGKASNRYVMRYRDPLVIYRVPREQTYLGKDSFYNETFHYRSLSALSNVGAWQQVESRQVLRNDTLDLHIFLTPAYRHSTTYSLEASRNTGDLTGSRLFGIVGSATYRNRNLWRRAVQSITTISAGVEFSFDSSLFQTLQGSISQTLIWPRIVFPGSFFRRLSYLESKRTVLNVNAAYSDRRSFFRLRTLIGSWGYEVKHKKYTALFYFPIPKIEIYSLDTLSGLQSAFDNTPFLRTAFNTGIVVAWGGNITVAFNGKHHTNVTHYVHSALEISGLPLKSLRDNVYQYVKLQAEYRKLIRYKNTSLAYRAFAGAGYNFSSSPKFGNTLPFFKQFLAGGPNSMRAWGLRQLGLGSSLQSDTSSVFRDRFGDMQLEANAEYRFPLFNIGSFKVSSALFADAGNIWNIKSVPGNEAAEFRLSRLWQDVAIGTGTGLRFDFGFNILIRLDVAYKLKDPARLANGGWVDFNNFWRNNEFRIVDRNGNVINRNNYSFQLGIGLPF